MLSKAVSNIEDAPSKREKWLVMGSARVRVPTDIYDRLTWFCQSRRYSKTFDGALYLIAVGLNVIESAEGSNLIIVKKL